MEFLEKLQQLGGRNKLKKKKQNSRREKEEKKSNNKITKEELILHSYLLRKRNTVYRAPDLKKLKYTFKNISQQTMFPADPHRFFSSKSSS